MVIQRVDVLLPVAVVCLPVRSSLGQLERYWRDPDSGEAHVLDVVELIDDALPGACSSELVVITE